MNKTIYITTDAGVIKEEVLVQDEQGFYKVNLALRYILRSGIVLDTLLKDAGLEYIKRPPGEFYELWAVPVENQDSINSSYNFDYDFASEPERITS